MSKEPTSAIPGLTITSGEQFGAPDYNNPRHEVHTASRDIPYFRKEIPPRKTDSWQ
jgi:hypothetical protein